tara:strand:+ start:9255 stop:9716 length:462 start_codon:yes stop_codon:yes gene_type:complete
MYKKILIGIMTLIFAAAPVQLQAQELEGQVTALSLGEEAPFSGVLLDPVAASKMIVDQKYLRSEIELSLRKEFQKELSNKRLAFDLLKVDYDSLKKIHEETLSLKNKQINDLNLLLKEEMGDDNSQWWTFGGMAAGIVLSLAVFYASVEIANK